ncbi:MAG: amidohydrolase family protein [Candidatus Dormibacteraceae bacterium]
MKIDVHNHAFPEAVVELVNREEIYRIDAREGVVRNRQYAPHDLYPSLTDPAAKIGELERGGLDAAVICVEPGLFCYDVELEAAERMASTANSGLADFCAAFPDRLRWMAQVPLQAPERAARVLEEAADAGAVGVEIGTAIADRWPDEPEFEPFWAAAERRGLPVFVHPAYNRPHDGLRSYYLQNVIGNPLATTIFAERMICSGTLDRHPRARLILSHGGGFLPYQVGRLRHARTVRSELASAPQDPWSYTRQIFIDTITHDRDALAYLISRAGADRVVMGTDHPYDMASPSPMAELVAAAGPEVARRVAEENPARLFDLEGVVARA